MEKTIQLVSGTRQLNLKKSFQLGIRSLLTACSKEDISKAFGCFPKSEQEAIHRLFIQVITSLHEKIEDEFESLGLETHVGTVLDTVEQSVEEQRLDALFSDKTDVGDVQRDLSTAKQNEIQYLMSRLQMAERNKNMMEARVEQLRKEVQDVPVSADVITKDKSKSLSSKECFLCS